MCAMAVPLRWLNGAGWKQEGSGVPLALFDHLGGLQVVTDMLQVFHLCRTCVELRLWHRVGVKSLAAVQVHMCH